MRAVMGTEGLPGPLLCLRSPQKGDSPLQTSMTNERTPQLPRLRAGTEPETEREPCPAVLCQGQDLPTAPGGHRGGAVGAITLPATCHRQSSRKAND